MCPTPIRYTSERCEPARHRFSRLPISLTAIAAPELRTRSATAGSSPRTSATCKCNLQLQTRTVDSQRLVVVLHVQGFVHDGDSKIHFLEGGNFRFVHQRQANIVEPFEQAIAAERINGEGIAQAFIVGDGLLFEIDRHAISFVRFSALEKLIDLLV